MTDNTLYECFLITTDGATLTWTHLTRRQAMAVYKAMAKLNPLRSSTEAARFGWKEMV